jgi:UDP-glucuronate 4-epimerase
MAKIAITGLAGFIGSTLAHKLHADGHHIIGFDNYNDYYDPALKKARAAKLIDDCGIIVEKVDLRDADDLKDWMYYKRPDIVMHLAAYAGVRHSMVEPGNYVENNIVGTHNLIEACHHADIKKVVYASTSCVMAGNTLPWTEDEKLGYQLNPYGYSKATNESQFMASTIPSTVGLRFFTVYGPWGRPDMALFDFTKNIIAGNEIKLFNYGDMVRDFTYVDDIVQGISIILEKTLSDDYVKQIYNIGNGKQVQLMDFVDNIEKQLGRTAKKKLVPKHPADTQATWSDCTKLSALGYMPQISIEEGVEKFVSWYKSYYEVN